MGNDMLYFSLFEFCLAFQNGIVALTNEITSLSTIGKSSSKKTAAPAATTAAATAAEEEEKEIAKSCPICFEIPKYFSIVFFVRAGNCINFCLQGNFRLSELPQHDLRRLRWESDRVPNVQAGLQGEAADKVFPNIFK